MRYFVVAGAAATGTIVVLALALGFFQMPRNASAQEPQVIEELPIGTENVLKIKSVTEKSKVSHVQGMGLGMEGKKDGFGVVINALNEIDSAKDLEADVWEVSVSGAPFDIKPENFQVNTDLKAKETKVIKDFSFDEWFSYFEDYPGRYTVTARGYNAEYALAKAAELDAQGVEYENNELAVYSIEAEIVVGFDEVKIKESGNVIDAKNVEVAIDGSNQFEVTGDSPRLVIVSAKNTKDFPVSAMYHDVGFTVWNAKVTIAEGYDEITEYVDGACDVLQPGESTQVKSFTLDSGVYPLGGEGISKRIAGNDIAELGTYVVEVEGSTLPCVLDGQEIPGIQFRSIIAFEVTS